MRPILMNVFLNADSLRLCVIYKCHHTREMVSCSLPYFNFYFRCFRVRVSEQMRPFRNCQCLETQLNCATKSTFLEEENAFF